MPDKKAITTLQELSRHFNQSFEALQPVVDQYPMQIHSSVLGLISQPKDNPIASQFIPQIDELLDNNSVVDPLGEGQQSPVRQVVHRYPDRVVFLISNTCPSFCRFCMRKRWVGRQPQVTYEDIQSGINYIAQNRSIGEVILSGGEPFMRSDDCLLKVLSQLRQISHVTLIRIHSRVPILLPHRISMDLIEQIRRFHPIYLNLHINHVSELSTDAQRLIQRFVDAGFPLGSQTVLLKGINDSPEIMHELMQTLLSLRVRPYYIHQMDDTRGTNHFQTSIDMGLEIMAHLRGRISGMGVPQYMIDLPGGGGKIPLVPDYIVKRTSSSWHFRNYEGKQFEWKPPVIK